MRSLGIDIGGSSVKVAVVEDGRVVGGAQSGRYARPDRDTLVRVVGEAVQQLATASPAAGGFCVGLCMPGIVDPATGRVAVSVNVPGLVGLSAGDLIREALPAGSGGIEPAVFSDARAAAHDWWASQTPRPAGRVLGISLGTGVGGCVLDDGVQLVVVGASSGHLGQLDVSLGEEDPPLGPDGGKGSLEAYIGLPALLRRGGEIGQTLAGLKLADPAIMALRRAIRIAHAIYRPNHVVLLGGVGIRLAPLAQSLRESVSLALTSLARPGWGLHCGESDFHAARGAARLAAGGNGGTA